MPKAPVFGQRAGRLSGDPVAGGRGFHTLGPPWDICEQVKSCFPLEKYSRGVKHPQSRVQSGMTAVASISTSQFGRASAVTTTPVETGCTPLMYSPMVR